MGRQVGTIFDVVVDNTGGTDGYLHGIDFALADTSNTSIDGACIATHAGFDVIHQHLGTSASLDFGINCVKDVCKDSTTAYGSTTDDVPIFANDNDSILVMSVSKFDNINFAFDTTASHSIIPTFEYSTGGASGYNSFTPSDDTSGMTQPASVRFNSVNLVGWSTCTVTEATGGRLTNSTTGYVVQITRTRNNLPTSPIEDTIEVTSVSNEYTWDKNGEIFAWSMAVEVNVSTPQATANKIILYGDGTDGDLKCVFPNGSVTTIATN